MGTGARRCCRCRRRRCCWWLAGSRERAFARPAQASPRKSSFVPRAPFFLFSSLLPPPSALLRHPLSLRISRREGGFTALLLSVQGMHLVRSCCPSSFKGVQPPLPQPSGGITSVVLFLPPSFLPSHLPSLYTILGGKSETCAFLACEGRGAREAWRVSLQSKLSKLQSVFIPRIGSKKKKEIYPLKSAASQF